MARVNRTTEYQQSYDELILHPESSRGSQTNLTSTQIDDRSRTTPVLTPEQQWHQKQLEQRKLAIQNNARSEFLRRQHEILAHLKTNGGMHTWGKTVGQSAEFPAPQDALYANDPQRGVYGASKGSSAGSQVPTYRVHELDMVDGYKRILA